MSRFKSEPSHFTQDDSFEWLRPVPDSHVGSAVAVHALELDPWLWRGHQERIVGRLRRLIEHGPAIEKASAGWVLARWEMDRQNYQAAHQAIMTFHAHPEGMHAVQHQGPYLLAVQSSLACGDLEGAREILRKGVERFGELPDFVLARILLANEEGSQIPDLSSILPRVHAASGLMEVTLSGGGGHLFDQLQTDQAPAPKDPAGLPLVSVIVPAHNAANELPTALRSLRAQSWPRLEILIVDDGSSDDTLSIARAAAAEDPRIDVIALNDNEGAYPARNAGFERAKGVFVTVHDADDWSHPQKIESQARVLMENAALKASVSHWVRASNGLEMTRWRLENSWIYRNVSSLMIRRELRDEIGYWDRARANADTEYYYRILRAYGASAIEEVCPGVPLAFGRTLPVSLTNRSVTHMRTQYHGVRHDYLEAAHDWHRRAADKGDLYLPRQPAQRPFRVPAEISLGDLEGPPSDYDLVVGSDLLDADWYLQANPDVVATEMGAARHYLTAGASENRDPGPLFSTGGYRRVHGLKPEDNPLIHYLRKGRADGADCLQEFEGKLPGTISDVPRVLIFAHTSGETLFGAERSLLDVVERTARDGFCPIVVLPALRNAVYLERLIEISAAVEVLPQIWRSGLHPPSDSTIDATRALVRKYRPCEVHVNTVVQETPLIAARAENVPSVVYVREMPAEDPALCRALGMNAATLRRRLLDQADRFVMPSQAVADWLECPGRCTVRPNAVEEALFDLQFAPERYLKVALISSNIAKKGIGDYVAAARMVAATGRPVRFLLIGPWTDDLHRLQPVPPNVQFRDYASSPVEAIRQADIVLNLSHFAESFGRTVVEAMAAGRPVICYDRGAPPSLVISGRTGLVVPPDSAGGVAAAVLALDAARLQLGKMSLAARRRAREIQNQALA
ncbi:glycosyltransferase [Pelagerythrobacter sp.]|uniref:glycosyltransferase n=1 Tax=Pelagerythrobacter sp. TaxID=2800702 RepID=UPI0035B2440A